jgi:ADP-heptose:LPS heptosyltransferase
MPSCSGLRAILPGATIDYLTLEENRGIPEASGLFDCVYSIRHSTTPIERFGRAFSFMTQRRKGKYDVVIDLQRNWVSRFIRICLVPKAWSEFDRFSRVSAYTRTTEAVIAAGFPSLSPHHVMKVADSRDESKKLLETYGWQSGLTTILINPAGSWRSRNWPIERYVELVKLLTNAGPSQLLLLGTENLKKRVEPLLELKGPHVINMIGKTTLSESFSLMRNVDLMISEDSGLMHMACANGVPVVALFGSSRHDWSAPVGPQSVCLHSGDLECGACMTEICRFGDTHCLTRYSAQFVFDQCRRILDSAARTSRSA